MTDPKTTYDFGDGYCEGGTPDGSCADYKPHDLCRICALGQEFEALDAALARLEEHR